MSSTQFLLWFVLMSQRIICVPVGYAVVLCNQQKILVIIVGIKKSFFFFWGNKMMFFVLPFRLHLIFILVALVFRGSFFCRVDFSLLGTSGFAVLLLGI